MTLLRYDSKQRKLWVWRQRIHHGPVGLLMAAALVRWHRRWAVACVLWGLTDIRDAGVWFVLGDQLSLTQLDT